jgi:hypothetical protein
MMFPAMVAPRPARPRVIAMISAVSRATIHFRRLLETQRRYLHISVIRIFESFRSIVMRHAKSVAVNLRTSKGSYCRRYSLAYITYVGGARVGRKKGLLFW